MSCLEKDVTSKKSEKLNYMCDTSKRILKNKLRLAVGQLVEWLCQKPVSQRFDSQ
jgi:hypothetical protein